MSTLVRRLRLERPIITMRGFLSARVGTRLPTRQSSEGYICPVTGEALPCPNCCPLNNG